MNYFDRIMDKAFKVSDSKGEDYRIGSDKVHQNFINVARALDTTPQLVHAVYMKKHVDAFEHFVNTGGQSESEPIEDRLVDIINYAMLGMPLAIEEYVTVGEFEGLRQALKQSVLLKYRTLSDVPHDLSGIALLHLESYLFYMNKVQKLDPMVREEVYDKMGTNLAYGIAAAMRYLKDVKSQ